ncbi:hypothetical protein FWK35_00011906, partial [Aphis craccivora]
FYFLRTSQAIRVGSSFARRCNVYYSCKTNLHIIIV